LYDVAKRDIKFKCTAENCDVVDASIAEIDMLFQKNVSGQNFFVLLEIKHSHNSESRRIGRHQLRRLVNGLSIMNPHIWYCGLLLTYKGYELVLYTGDTISWEELNLPVQFLIEV
jgi:hypothetical protein